VKLRRFKGWRFCSSELDVVEKAAERERNGVSRECRSGEKRGLQKRRRRRRRKYARTGRC
jgi:hypothetical protein